MQSRITLARGTTMTEESLFQEALGRPPEERAAFLEQASAGQPDLRAAVEALLAAHEKLGHVVDKPLAGAAAASLTPSFPTELSPGGLVPETALPVPPTRLPAEDMSVPSTRLSGEETLVRETIAPGATPPLLFRRSE